MTKKNRNGLILLVIIFFCCIYTYVHVIMGPGKLDYFLRGGYYNEIMQTLLSPGSENILTIDHKSITFKNMSECFSNEKYGNPLCDKKYDQLFIIIYKSNIKWASASGNNGRIYHHSLIGGYHQIDYFYSKQGFIEQEKKAGRVRDVINDHWIISNY